jgi:low temperature requirement protein LtrA
MFFRRGGGDSNRFTAWRVGLFFLAAGTWLAGVLAERPLLTGAAIVIVLVAVMLGPLGRREE